MLELSRIKGLESLSMTCRKCNFVDSVGPSRVFSINEQIRRGLAYHAESCEKRQEGSAPKEESLPEVEKRR